jgi:hypothetical protein
MCAQKKSGKTVPISSREWPLGNSTIFDWVAVHMPCDIVAVCTCCLYTVYDVQIRRVALAWMVCLPYGAANTLHTVVLLSSLSSEIEILGMHNICVSYSITITTYCKPRVNYPGWTTVWKNIPLCGFSLCSSQYVNRSLL